MNRATYQVDGSGSARSYFASQAFTEVWIPFMHNVYEEPELLRDYVTDKPGGFYAALYDELAAIDGRLADFVTLSTSW